MKFSTEDKLINYALELLYNKQNSNGVRVGFYLKAEEVQSIVKFDKDIIPKVVEKMLRHNLMDYSRVGRTLYVISKNGLSIQIDGGWIKHLKRTAPKKEVHWFIKDTSKGMLGVLFGVIGTLATQYILSPKPDKETNSYKDTLQAESQTEFRQENIKTPKIDTIKQ